MKIEHWPTEGIVAIELVDGPDDYGRSIAEGVVAHFRKAPESEEDILVRIEVEADHRTGRRRDVSEVHVEERDENGNVAVPAMIAKTLEELRRHGLMEQIKATEKPKATQKSEGSFFP